jgi:hypothetical protein
MVAETAPRHNVLWAAEVDDGWRAGDHSVQGLQLAFYFPLPFLSVESAKRDEKALV